MPYQRKFLCNFARLNNVKQLISFPILTEVSILATPIYVLPAITISTPIFSLTKYNKEDL